MTGNTPTEKLSAPAQPAQVGPGLGRLTPRGDSVLTYSLWAAAISVLLLGIMFAWEVAGVRSTEGAATPVLRAITELEAAVRENPDSDTLRVRLGEALGAGGKYAQAVEQLQAALKINPDHDGAYRALAIISAARGDLESAKGYYLKVLELTEGDDFAGVNARRAEALFALGSFALDAKQYEEAVGYLKQSLRIRRDAADAYYRLAQAYLGLEESDAALQQLEYALTFDPGFTQAHFLSGQIYLDRGDYVNASSFLYRAAELDPAADPPAEALASIGTSEQWLEKSRDSLGRGDSAGALKEALVARNLAPDSGEAAVMHLRVLVDRGSAETSKVVSEAKSLVASGSPLAKELEALAAKATGPGR